MRVTNQDEQPPGTGRAILRFVGLLLAIVPLFAGFIPMLLDRRRRGLQDYLGATVVLYTDRRTPLSGDVPCFTRSARCSETRYGRLTCRPLLPDEQRGGSAAVARRAQV